MKAIVDAGCKVYSARKHKQWPSVEPYPLKEVLRKLKLDKNYWWSVFDNSIVYAVALALSEGYRKIGLYGCEFVNRYDELELQVANYRWKLKGYDAPEWFGFHDKNIVWSRAPQEPGSESLHFWLGWAHAEGVEIVIPTGSTILNSDRKPHFYGYQEQPKL